MDGRLLLVGFFNPTGLNESTNVMETLLLGLIILRTGEGDLVELFDVFTNVYTRLVRERLLDIVSVNRNLIALPCALTTTICHILNGTHHIDGVFVFRTFAGGAIRIVEKKEMFKIPEEIRSIKYILVKKEASQADRTALYKAMEKCAQQVWHVS